MPCSFLPAAPLHGQCGAVPASLLGTFSPLLHPSWLLQAGGMGI